MKRLTLLTLTLLTVSGAMAQRKPRKVTEMKKDTSMFIGLTDSQLLTTSSVYRFPTPDTVLAYFNEITGVQDGKLITQWVKGWRVDRSNNGTFYYINTGGEFYYPDKKTKVTNKIIQSY